jgi:hypothetical protein
VYIGKQKHLLASAVVSEVNSTESLVKLYSAARINSNSQTTASLHNFDPPVVASASNLEFQVAASDCSD